jgi:hypothetical protein
MVCAVCSVEHRESGELVILDYLKYVQCESPCPNCGVVPGVSNVELKQFTKAAAGRHRFDDVICSHLQVSHSHHD